MEINAYAHGMGERFHRLGIDVAAGQRSLDRVQDVRSHVFAGYAEAVDRRGERRLEGCANHPGADHYHAPDAQAAQPIDARRAREAGHQVPDHLMFGGMLLAPLTIVGKRSVDQS
jgi:hypothetical protein